MNQGHEEEHLEPEIDTILDEVTNVLLNGATFKDIHGIPQNTMDDLYAYAYEFYQQGKLQEAETFFRFLSTYDFYNTDYVMGLAAVYQLTKRYEKATELYTLAFVLAKNDYRPLFYAGQCNLQLKKSGAALHCFESVYNSSNDESLKQKSLIYLNALNKNLESEHPKVNDVEQENAPA